MTANQPQNSVSPRKEWRIGANRNPAAGPVLLQSPDDRQIFIKVDVFARRGDLFILGGWCSEKITPALADRGGRLPALQVAEIARPDVNRHLGTDESIKHGFALAARHAGKEGLALAVALGGAEVLLALPAELPDAIPAAGLDAIVGPQIRRLALGEDSSWTSLLAAGPNAPLKGVIDYAILWPDIAHGSPLVVSGWLAMPDGAQLLAGDEDGARLTPVRPVFFSRQEISAEYDLWINKDRFGNGFIFVLPDFEAAHGVVCLYAQTEKSTFRLASANVNLASNYRKYLRALFEIDVNPTELAAVYRKAYLPLLRRLNQDRCGAILRARHCGGQYGDPVPNPEVSIIIPLYGSLELLVSQLNALARERPRDCQAEIIYVLDDPDRADEFKLLAAPICKSLGLGLRWIYWNGSQGFSGANNLGAAIAGGKYLIFLNSDVFPESGGWIRGYADYLRDHPEAGLLGCRLVYQNGALQHLGVHFAFDAAMNIWKCVHPQKGTIADMPREPFEAEAVTGASLAMRKADFDALGGWSTEYLIGGYEDMDLCQRVKKSGKKVVCLPRISMIHLESRTFAQLEKSKWLDRLAVFNAAVFTQKFPDPQATGK